MRNKQSVAVETRSHHLDNYRSPDLIREFSEVFIDSVANNLEDRFKANLPTFFQHYAPKTVEYWLEKYIECTVLNHWPREHGMFMLAQAAELARGHWIMHRHQGEALDMNWFDRQFQLDTYIVRRDLDNSEDRLTAWLTNISVAVLC
ncbi:hypothetical protein, partial [Vibrio hepatarius]|uniref:hypothetical protein n=1 Tax=Vibrio hepatarius TaxID=171383 RepID=UPI00142DE7D1